MIMPNNDFSSLKVLVCGAGSVGTRHIKNLQYIGVKVSVWRSRHKLLEKLKNEFSVDIYSSIEEGIENSDAVIIATVTSKHLDIAFKAAKMGKHIFIEKPISNNTKNINKLKNIVQESQLIFEVGCQLRAHPNLQKLSQLISQNNYGPLYTFRSVVGQRLENWRPGTDYTKSYSANSSLGGGALLDLIHEIDLLHWLTGPIESVYANLSQVSDQEINSEDLVNMVLFNSNGAIGQLQMDMLSPELRRGMELVFQKGIFFWDYFAGTLTYQSEGSKSLINQVPDEFNRNSLFLIQMKHFINRVIDPNIKPLCSIDDGIKSLKIVEAAKLSSLNNQAIKL
jgi:predicted dehydrogenase